MDDIQASDLALGCVFAPRVCQVCEELDKVSRRGRRKRLNEGLSRRHISYQRDPLRWPDRELRKKRAAAANPHHKKCIQYL